MKYKVIEYHLVYTKMKIEKSFWFWKVGTNVMYFRSEMQIDAYGNFRYAKNAIDLKTGKSAMQYSFDLFLQVTRIADFLYNKL